MKKQPAASSTGDLEPTCGTQPIHSKQALRRQAEVRLAQSPDIPESLSPDEIRERLHELRVHQIELEMQNEELRTAQGEIEAGRARYFDLYDLAPVGYCTLSEQGLIREANLTAAALLGVPRSALVMQPLSRFILNEDQDLYYLHRKKLFETGQPQTCELRLVKPDGAFFWTHLTATVTRAEDGAPVWRVVLSDISEQKRAEEALRESERHLRSTLDGLSAHITVLDESGEILLTNKAYRDFGERNGVAPNTVSEGTNYLAVCDAASGQHCQEAGTFAGGIRDVLAGQRLSFELEYPCHSPDEERWFTGRVTPIQGEGPRRVVIAHENITERKRSENMLAFLAQSSSNPAAGDFFQLLARHIAETLDMEFVCIDRLDGDHLTAHTEAVYSNGTFADNVSYALKDTPCGEVVGKQVCCFPASVKTLFPKDAVLQHMEAESYIGVTLWSHDGRPIGLIAVIGARPLTHRAQAEALLRLVGVRAAAELERKQVEEEIIESMHELKRLYNATLNREDRVLELKDEVNTLLERLGQPHKFFVGSKQD